MNHPEFRPVIVFDDTVFVVGDTIEITTTKELKYKGLVMEIKRDHFLIENGKGVLLFFYDQVEHMKLTDLSECDS